MSLIPMNLVPAINEIKAQIRNIEARHRKEIAPYLDSLAAMRKINTACEKCGGTGKVFRRACAEDDGCYQVCDECKGTGKAQIEEESFTSHTIDGVATEVILRRGPKEAQPQEEATHD